MTTRTIGDLLRTVLLAGSVCAFPALAQAEGGAETGSNEAEHANVEARRGAADVPENDRISGAPDHNEAEERGPASAPVPTEEKAGATDHGAVERRGSESR
jgi:hypothetical protein